MMLAPCLWWIVVHVNTMFVVDCVDVNTMFVVD